jgi:S-DNA-T family DNA segregation ATPase FtsK/SpoIIIE
MESRSVLGVPDAYELPRSPGHGYLKTGTEGMARFRAAYVSGTYRRGGGRVSGRRPSDPVRPYTTWYQPPRGDRDEQPALPVAEDVEVAEAVAGETLLGVLGERLQSSGVPAHQVWLPPLVEPPTLDQLLPSIATEPGRGLTTTTPELLGSVQGVVGIIDKPFEQRRELLRLDLSSGAGNVVVVGGPQSGKSTLLRSLLGSLTLCHTPREAQFYCLDFGGGSLTALRDLPHVGGVATRAEVDQVRRTVAEMYGLLLSRERLFAEQAIDGMASYRRLKRDGRFAEDPFGDAFLVVDGWLTLRNAFEDLEPMVTELANRGLGYGIHLIVSSGRWMDLRRTR